MRIVKYIAVLVSLIVVVGLMGCNSDDVLSDHTTFKNESTSTVTITPAHDEIFNPFNLAPGQEVRVGRVGHKIDYTYTATGEVVVAEVENIEVLFTDPINL